MADAATATANLTLTDRTIQAGRDTLTNRRRGLRGFMPFAGPAIVASIAYTDPGNFATNIQAGARYGYTLLWVVLAANLIAMLFQSLSARVGIVTGHSLAELCRRHFPRPLVVVMWLVSEVAAMATDLAELVGAAIGLSLLTGMPMLPSLIAAFVITCGLLSLQSRGFRPLELVIATFVGIISVSYLVELVIAPPDWRLFAYHAVVPQLADAGAVTLAVGIIGATVMPHAIYLHSALMPNRMPTSDDQQRRRVISLSNREVLIALGLAGAVNMAMVAMAAVMFHAGHPDVGEIETAYHTLLPLMGGVAAGAFMASLLASGLSSSVVGTMAGQSILQDFTGWRISIWVRRLVTMLPALAVVAAGVNATEALVMSQVALSLALPVPMLALLTIVGRPAIMGAFATGRAMRTITGIATAIVVSLNIILLLQAVGVALPFLPAG